MPSVPVHQGLFTEEGDGLRLVAGTCHECGHPHFPRLTTCPICGSADVASTLLSTTGTLWAWTAVTAAPPGYRGEVPYGFGVVELPEGLRVITRLTVADPAQLLFGQPMQLVAEVLHVDDGDEVITWAFAPATESAG